MGSEYQSWSTAQLISRVMELEKTLKEQSRRWDTCSAASDFQELIMDLAQQSLSRRSNITTYPTCKAIQSSKAL